MLVTDQIERRRLGRRGDDHPTRRVEPLDRYVVQAFTDDERNLYGATPDGPARFREKNLKFLGPVVRCAVILRSRQQTGIVPETKSAP